MLVYTEKEDGTTNIAPVSFFQIPEDVRTAFLVSLDDTMQTGNHTLYSCKVNKIYGESLCHIPVRLS